MPIELVDVATCLGSALLLGATIGFERQWRQRFAGLRTNTLVALGAATFVVFGRLLPGDLGSSRMAAQVVSGIRFLGAGIIFREGLNVRGLNTAATPWCSAAIGVLAGAGALAYAALATAMVVSVNLQLRPLVQRINPQRLFSTEMRGGYLVSVVGKSEREANVRALLLQGLSAGGLHLRSLDSSNIEDSDRVEVLATLTAEQDSAKLLEQIVGRLSLEPSVTAVRWRVEAVTE
jgi:putative Mg2+ transporter-C (MgtC) family protein